MHQRADQHDGLKANAVYFFKKNIMEVNEYNKNTIRSYLVTIVPMAPFTTKSTSQLRSALHIKYSMVIPRIISRANTAQS